MTLLPLAQLSDEAMTPLVQWILGGSAAVFLLNQVLTFWKEHMREQPAPANTYATKEELRFAHGRITRERVELDAAIAELRDEASARREALEAKFSALDDRIDAVPERTLNLLRTTKGLL